MDTYLRTEVRPVHRGPVRLLLFSAVVLLLMLASACNRAPESATAASNDPDQLFRQMSDKLAQAKTLSFKVDRKLDAALVEGRDIAENAQIEISVSRPNKFVAKSDSKENVRHIFFDGQNVSIYDETMKLYATVPLSGSQSSFSAIPIARSVRRSRASLTMVRRLLRASSVIG
jgi:hypothetical protein